MKTLMNHFMTSKALLPIALSFCLACPAHAQVGDIPQSVTQGAQIEQAVTQANRQAAAGQAAGEVIDGEAGVFILRRQEIFFASANAGIGYSSNPLRNADDVGGSGFVQGTLNAGVRTRLGDTVDFTAAASLDHTEYFRDFGPSNSVLSGAVSVGMPIAGTPLYVGINGFGGWNYDQHFRNDVGFYGVGGTFAANIPLTQRLILQPGISGTRVWTDIGENDTTTASARLGLTYVGDHFSANVFGGASRVWFDNFYEDVTFIERRDWQYEGSIGGTYQPVENLQMSASLRYTKRTSPFFLAEYDSWDAGAAISLILRF